MKIKLEFYSKNGKFIQALGFVSVTGAIAIGKAWEKKKKGNYYVTIC